MPDSSPTADGEGPHVPLNQRAVLSVGLALVAFLLLVFEPFLSLLLSMPSLTISIYTRREVLAAHGAQRGFDLAGAGLAIGSATMLLSVVAVFLDLL